MEEAVAAEPEAGSTSETESSNVSKSAVTAPVVAAGAPVGSHVIMQPSVPAASRRPDGVEDGVDKGKRNSDDGYTDRAEEAGVPPARITAPIASYPGIVEEEGTCGSSFLIFLNDLEAEGVVTLHQGDVPTRLKGVCGWTVHDDKMDVWKRRRQDWFMQGKEGKQYKANSFYQFLRRLGFFPTEGTKRASHGLDFDGSRTFKWDGSRRHKYIQSKKEKQALSMQANSRNILRPSPGDMMGGMVMGTWQTPMEPPGRPLPVHPPGMGPPPGMFAYPWGTLQGLTHSHPHSHPHHPHYGAPPTHLPHTLNPYSHPHHMASAPVAVVTSVSRPAAPAHAATGDSLMRLMSANGSNAGNGSLAPVASGPPPTNPPPQPPADTAPLHGM